MPTLRHRLRRQLDAGIATPLLICAMGTALWFVSHHWHERAFTILGMGALAVLSVADLQRRRRHNANERTLQSILDAVPDILFFKDTTLRYRRVNRAFASTFQRDVDTVAGRNDRELFGKRLHDRFVAQDRQLLATGEARTFDERMRIGGELRDVRARKKAVFDARGSCDRHRGHRDRLSPKSGACSNNSRKAVEEARAAAAAKSRLPGDDEPRDSARR
jgi:PAS domain-containing protein